jgi:transcriptional regulator with XRE-family HTH domain
LRRAREAKNLTQQQVADALEWSLSKVTRIENGDVTISNTDLRALLELVDITDDDTITRFADDARASRRRGWWDEPHYRDHLTAATLQLLQFESEATAIRVFQPTLFPGMLQTQGYAEAVLAFWRDELSDEARTARLEVRLNRAREVLDGDDPPKYLVILDESVAHREVGGPKEMAELFRELLVRMASPRVTVRILPYSEGVMAQIGAFNILDLDEEENAVLYRESLNTDDIVHTSSEVQRHRRYFESMWERSLDPEASERVIQARLAALLTSLDRGRSS